MGQACGSILVLFLINWHLMALENILSLQTPSFYGKCKNALQTLWINIQQLKDICTYPPCTCSSSYFQSVSALHFTFPLAKKWPNVFWCSRAGKVSQLCMSWVFDDHISFLDALIYIVCLRKCRMTEMLFMPSQEQLNQSPEENGEMHWNKNEFSCLNFPAWTFQQGDSWVGPGLVWPHATVRSKLNKTFKLWEPMCDVSCTQR